jgi:hypothetical protein
MGGTAHVVSNSLDCRSALFVGSFDVRTNNLDFNFEILIFFKSNYQI